MGRGRRAVTWPAALLEERRELRELDDAGVRVVDLTSYIAGSYGAMMLAEAGTGVGKTLGYLAPASLWAEANGPAVWVSTYTRALQRQIERESRAMKVTNPIGLSELKRIVFRPPPQDD